MAYMSQEKKKTIAPVVKAICKRHGVKATLAVRHHSTLVLNISEGSIDFFADLNPYRAPWGRDDMQEMADKARAHAQAIGHMDANRADEYKEGSPARAFFDELFPALNDGNHDRSDIMTDYFDVGWYVDVNVGQWDKPYRLTGAPTLPPPVPEPVAEAPAEPAPEVEPVRSALRLVDACDCADCAPKHMIEIPAPYPMPLARA